MIFLFGAKKSVREMLTRAIRESDLPTFVKHEIESALIPIDTEMQGEDRKEFDEAFKVFDKTKDSLVRILDAFILIKRSVGVSGLEALASITEKLRTSQAI